MTRLTAVVLLLLMLTLSAIAHDARAETYQTCSGFITSVPAVISTQGTWCLKQDLSTAMTSGDAITINTNNVTLDCNNYKLGGLAGGVGTGAFGVHSNGHLNVTIRHCNVRGFLVGVILEGSGGGGNVVEDSRFDGNTYVGLWVEGDGSVIQRNRVFDTGGTPVLQHAFGIVSKFGVDLIDNTVTDVVPASASNGAAVGITLEGSLGGSRIIGNSVRGLVKDGTGGSYGIYAVNGSVRVILRDNDVLGDGATGSGLSCTNANSRAIGNTISAFSTPMVSCSDDGGNVIAP